MVVHQDSDTHSLNGKRITADAINGCPSAKQMRAFVSRVLNSPNEEFSMRFDERLITGFFDKFRGSF